MFAPKFRLSDSPGEASFVVRSAIGRHSDTFENESMLHGGRPGTPPIWSWLESGSMFHLVIKHVVKECMLRGNRAVCVTS